MEKKTTDLRGPASVIDMEPEELHKHPELLADYIRWKDNPITKMVFGMLSKISKPNANGTDFSFAMAADKGVTGAILYARLCGAQHMLDAAMSFDEIENPPEDLDADFNAEEILKNEKLPTFED